MGRQRTLFTLLIAIALLAVAEPTIEPTYEPGVPTPETTADPSAVPSADPTADPSAVPSADPSAVPSAAPTTPPGAVPTASPSAIPTVYPETTPPAASPEPTSPPEEEAVCIPPDCTDLPPAGGKVELQKGVPFHYCGYMVELTDSSLTEWGTYPDIPNFFKLTAPDGTIEMFAPKYDDITEDNWDIRELTVSAMRDYKGTDTTAELYLRINGECQVTDSPGEDAACQPPDCVTEEEMCIPPYCTDQPTEGMCVPPDCTETPVDEMCIPPRCTDLTGSFNHITNPSFEDGINGWEVKLEGTFDEKWCPHGDGTELKQLRKGEKLTIGTGEIPPFDGDSFLGSWVCSTGASSIVYRQRLGMAPGLLNDLTFALYDTFPESDPNDSWKWSFGVQVELLDASENSLYTLTYGITRDDYEFPPITATSMTRKVEPAIAVEGNKWKAFALHPAREIIKSGIDPTNVALVDLRFVVKGSNANYYLLLDDVKMGHGLGPVTWANYFDNPEGFISPSSSDQMAPMPGTKEEDVRKWSWKDDPDGDKDKDCIPNAKDACPETPGVSAEEGCPLDDEIWELTTVGPGVTSARFEWRYAREYKVYAKSFAVKVTKGPSPKIDGVETVDTVSDEYSWHTVTVGPYNPSTIECLDLSVTFMSQDPLWAADTFTLTPCTKVVGKSQGTVEYYLNGQDDGKLRVFGRTGYDPVTINVKVSDAAGQVLADKDVKKDLAFEGENLEGLLNVAVTNTYRSDCDKMISIESDYPVLLSAAADGALAYTRKEVVEEYGLDALVLATTINYPDAIVAGAVAQKLGVPVLLTPPEALSEDVASFIADEKPKEIIILGGTSVISADIEDKLLADGFDVVRLWGMTRFGTAAELAQYAWNAGVDEAVVVYDRIEGAEGDEHTQLMMAKSLATARTVPILLTSNEELPEATKEALEDLGVKKVTLVGPAFAAEVVEALDALDIDVDVVTGETVEEVNEKLQEEVVEELEKSLPEGELTRLVVVAAGTDFMASISLPSLPEATASMVLADEEQIQDIIDFITEHGITQVTVVGIPELTSKVVARLLMVEGIEVSALSTKAIEKSLVDRLKERKDTWKEHRKERLVDKRRELIRRGDEVQERTERAVEKAQRIITEVSAALDEFKAQELPDELKPVLEMFEKELGRARGLVERATELTANADGDGRAYADAIKLLKKAEGVARDAKFRGMKMIAEAERRQRDMVRNERDALADDIFGELEERESLRNRIIGKRDKLDELRERVKERQGEKKFGPSFEGKTFGPKFGGDRFGKRDLGNKRIGKDFTARGDSCKKCLTKCDREEEGPECAFICADSCGQSPCELCHEHCPNEAPMPEMCPMICDEVCSMAADVADARGFKPPMPPGRDDERISSGVTCCQPDHGANTPACTVDLGRLCPEGYRTLEDESVDPFDDFNCVGERGKRGPRCDEFGLSDLEGRPDEERNPPEDDDWLPPTDAFRRGPGPRCKGCMVSCVEKGKDGAECGFVCEPVCQESPCDLCEGWCDITGIPMRDCDMKCMPACDERSDRDGFGEGRQCERCVGDCLEEISSLEQCSGMCADPCHRDPCGVCNSYCMKGSGDPRECREKCGRVCGGRPADREPEHSDPVTECRDKCKRSGDLGACMQQCLGDQFGGQGGPEIPAERPEVPQGPGPIEVCRKQCTGVSDTRACMDQCIAREEGQQGTSDGQTDRLGPGYGPGPGPDYGHRDPCGECHDDCEHRSGYNQGECHRRCDDDACRGGGPGFGDPCDMCHGECDRSDWQDQGSCHARCDEDKCGGGPHDECDECWDDCKRSGDAGCEERCKPICERFHPPMPPPGDMCGECWYKCEDREQRPQHECERECEPVCEYGGMPPPPPPHDHCGNCFYECEFKENRPWSECEQRCKPECGFDSGPDIPPGDLVGESNPQPAPYPGDLVGESNPQPAPGPGGEGPCDSFCRQICDMADSDPQQCDECWRTCDDSMIDDIPGFTNTQYADGHVEHR